MNAIEVADDDYSEKKSTESDILATILYIRLISASRHAGFVNPYSSATILIVYYEYTQSELTKRLKYELIQALGRSAEKTNLEDCNKR